MSTTSVISFTQQKGGTGKTTSTLNVAGHLSKRGYRVLVVDLDPQASSTTGLGISLDSIDEHMYDVLVGDCTMSDIIMETEGGCHIAPAGLDLIGADMVLHDLGKDKFFVLSSCLDSIRDYYDFIMIDVPPGSGILAFNSIEASNMIFIPFDPGIFALESFQALEILLSEFGNMLGRDICVDGAILTRWKKVSTQWERGKTLNQLADQLTEKFGKLFIVPFTNKIYEAQLAGLPISHFSPRSVASLAYEQIAEYIEEKIHERNKETRPKGNV